MNMLRVDLELLSKASRATGDAAEELRATRFDDDIARSGWALNGADLASAAQTASDSCEAARRDFAARIEQHSEALAETVRIIGDVDRSSAIDFRLYNEAL